MTWFFSVFKSKTPHTPPSSKNIVQLLGFINDTHKYLSTRLYLPNATIVKLHFLDRSTPQNARNATLTIQQFFNDTKEQLETYKTVITSLPLPSDESFYQHIRTETLQILNFLITQCQFFSDNASYYAAYETDATLKQFLNHALKSHLATLESFSQTN